MRAGARVTTGLRNSGDPGTGWADPGNNRNASNRRETDQHSKWHGSTLQALAIDIVVVLVFALIGRQAHDESPDVLGVLSTAWPFLVGTLIGTLVNSMLARTWRVPVTVRTGLVVWASTVVFGLLLRLVTHSTDQWPFVIVATVVLGVLLLGWRVAARSIRRARQRLQARTGPSRH